MTEIKDTLTYANGRKVNGRIAVYWRSFLVSGNVSIAGGMVESEIIDGDLDLLLEANAGTQPLNNYYTAKYELENGPLYEEYWIVPTLSKVTLSQIRVQYPVQPSAMINPIQLTSVGASAGMFLQWNGTSWVPGYASSENFTPNYITVNAGTGGSDVNIAGSPVKLGAVLTIHIPDAGLAARGVVNTANQSFAGTKTFQRLVVTTAPLSVGGSNVVTESRQINTGTGLSGGGDLSADRTLVTVDDATTQRIRMLSDGTLRGTRPAVNFIHGANVTVQVQDNVGENRVDVAISSSGGGADGGMVDPTLTVGDLIVRGNVVPERLPVGLNGQVLTVDTAQILRMKWGPRGAEQTPWTSNIDGANFKLYSVSSVGINVANPSAPLEVQSGPGLTARLRGGTAGANNNTQLRFFGAKSNADLWALGTDVVVGNGVADFHFYDISKGNSVLTLQYVTGNVAVGGKAPYADPAHPFQVHTSSDRNILFGNVGGEIAVQCLNDAINSYQTLDLYASRFQLKAGNVGIGSPASVPDILTINNLGAYGQLRMVYGGYGCFFRNDGATWYFMVTAPNDPYGLWAGPYPMQIDLASHAVTISGALTTAALTVSGVMSVNSRLTTTACQSAISNGVASDFTWAAIQVRETNQAGGAVSGDNRYAPRISFHWAGVVASQIGMDNTGWIRTFDNPGTSYAPFRCSQIQADRYNDATLQTSGQPPAGNQIVRTDANGYLNATWINTISGDSGLAGISRIYASGDAFIRYYSVDNFAKVTYAYYMAWKNYGAPQHIIFDASQGTAPNGAGISSTDSQVAWSGSYPTLMGWNGSSTYGVRVDRARYADSAGSVAGGASITVQGNDFTYGTRPIINFRNNVGITAFVGDDPAGNRVGVSFAATSDIRIKQNVTDLSGGLPVIHQLRPVSFEFNGLCGSPAGRRSASIIAQELQQVLPDCVFPSRGKLRPGDEEETDILCWDPNQVLAHAILALKQLDQRLQALEGKVN